MIKAKGRLKFTKWLKCLWGIRYKDFIKTRLNDEQLIESLRNLRRWSNEFDDPDLKEKLLNTGWEMGGVK